MEFWEIQLYCRAIKELQLRMEEAAFQYIHISIFKIFQTLIP